jgi:Phosphatase
MTIDPEHTTVAAARASARLGEVAGERGRVALATGRPASLLSAYGAIAAALEP